MNISKELIKTLSYMNDSKNQFKVIEDKDNNQLLLNGVVIKPLGGNSLKIGNNTYELTSEVQNALKKQTRILIK